MLSSMSETQYRVYAFFKRFESPAWRSFFFKATHLGIVAPWIIFLAGLGGLVGWPPVVPGIYGSF